MVKGLVIVILGGLNEMMNAEHLAQGQAYNKYSSLLLLLLLLLL